MFEKQVTRALQSSPSSANGGGSPSSANGNTSPTQRNADCRDGECQTDVTGKVMYGNKEIDPTSFAVAHEKAMLAAMVCSRPRVLKFTERKNRQNAFAEPQEKEEPIRKETFTMKSSLEALREILANREKQISSLQAQVDVCEASVKRETETCKKMDDTLESLKENRANVQEVYSDLAAKRLADRDQLKAECSKMKADAKRYEALAKSQHAFFLQTEAIFQRTGQEKIQRFPAGDVFVMPQPLPLDEDEKGEEWDIGTAVANPYVVDSWPFEPNVLARRCQHEQSLEEVTEETFEDLVEARRPAPKIPP